MLKKQSKMMMIVRPPAIILLRRQNLSIETALPISLVTGCRRGGVQRMLASSSEAPTPVRSSTQSKDVTQEAIEKSQRLHAELTEMIAAQKARQTEEMQRPFGSNFVSFVKASKSQIINIIFAFVCVILAYQIHGMRAGIRKLQAAQTEKDADIDRLRNILANLSEGTNGSRDDSFAVKLAQKCADAVRSIFQESERRVGYSWILGKKLASGDTLELHNIVDQLQSVILSELQAAVGDAAFTPDELKKRRVAALKVEKDIDGIQLNMSAGKLDAHMGDLMGILEEVHNQDLIDGGNDKSDVDDDGNTKSTKVRRTRYAI
ncbi:hypothetical protein ACHAXA_006211 [Cyclostephanos tholiformis]|uniref:Uncharacterized protein n=1 Tax=Cyclostephanos tholiformis TaxID=382380 RepID=A0ABD3SET7_9STRA